MITRKLCTIDIGCEDCERTIPKGEPCLEVQECVKICVECGMRRRDEWCAFFEQFDLTGTPEEQAQQVKDVP